VGIVDAAIGFDLALAPGYNKMWVPLVIAVAILLLFVAGIRYCFDTHRKDQQESAALDRRNVEAWREYQNSQSQQQQYANQYTQPPAYGGFGAYKQPDVEMRPVAPDGQYGQVHVPGRY
jgi:hypothetical protein